LQQALILQPRLIRLNTKYLVSAGDKAPGKNVIVLLGYQASGFGNHYMHLLSDYSVGKYFNGNKRKIDLPNGTVMGKAEGIAFRNAAYGYISNEQLFTVNQKLRSFNISDLVPLYVLPLTLKKFTVNKLNDAHKIAWSFNDPVKDMQLQYSTNGFTFSVLKTYNITLSDIYYHKLSAPVNYYRLSWHNNNGSIQYSNIISIKDKEQRSLKNFSLRSNGKLKFLLSGNSAANYSFKLLSSDGKVISQIKAHSYSPGLNTITISKKPVINNFVYLSVYSDKQETTTFIRVEK
jgi:hypothetical protein